MGQASVSPGCEGQFEDSSSGRIRAINTERANRSPDQAPRDTDSTCMRALNCGRDTVLKH